MYGVAQQSLGGAWERTNIWFSYRFFTKLRWCGSNLSSINIGMMFTVAGAATVLASTVATHSHTPHLAHHPPRIGPFPDPPA